MLADKYVFPLQDNEKREELEIDDPEIDIRVNDNQQLSIKGQKVDFDILGSNTP